MPKEGAKPSKYDNEIITEELGPNYEQKQWEEDKLGQAKMRFGAKDAKDKNKVVDQDMECMQCPNNHSILKLTLTFRVLDPNKILQNSNIRRMLILSSGCTFIKSVVRFQNVITLFPA